MADKGPRILLLASNGRFAGTARLPYSLVAAGATVTLVCEATSFLHATRYAHRKHTLPPRSARLADLRRKVGILRALLCQHDLVVAMDEATLRLLHKVRNQIEGLPFPWRRGLPRVLARSLPQADRIQAALLRWDNQQLAESLGLRTPEACPVGSLAELRTFVDRVGLPVVLKADHSTAGTGVEIASDWETAARWYQGHAPTHASSPVTVQKFIKGTPAMRSVAVLNGKVLDGISALKIACHPEKTGPSSIIQIIENPEMGLAAERMCAALGLSGYASFDFIVEHTSGKAYLIECNPRPTPICHLGSLSASLVQALMGHEPKDKTKLPTDSKIALYPQEWLRSGPDFCTDGLVLDSHVEDDPALAEQLQSYIRKVHAAAGN